MGALAKEARHELVAMLRDGLPQVENRVWANRNARARAVTQYPHVVIFSLDEDITSEHNDRVRKPRIGIQVVAAAGHNPDDTTADDLVDDLMEEIEQLLDREFPRESLLCDSNFLSGQYASDDSTGVSLAVGQLTIELSFMEPRPKPHARPLPLVTGIGVTIKPGPNADPLRQEIKP